MSDVSFKLHQHTFNVVHCAVILVLHLVAGGYSALCSNETYISFFVFYLGIVNIIYYQN